MYKDILRGAQRNWERLCVLGALKELKKAVEYINKAEGYLREGK